MGDVRTNLFADDDAADLDLSSFRPAKPVRQSEEATKTAAAKAGFVSREPKVVPATPVPEKPARRVWRTGRNVQLNLKATPETVAAFYAIADAQGWVLGEALEKAVELLREKYAPKAG
ncbi:stability/partitioning determinant [Ancylobacter polymorphus]|uniref:Stability/partitioning determinant n=1 Tax=Ancylobacter polymorphus TaxID=223390 RepID=A0A9E7A1T2_9HYPH|nr:stability/partitioning determinant [Ancylobacter polymorphus]UOK73967.1 stability/partitioning determinant [Ancylobacter polymorphus]